MAENKGYQEGDQVLLKLGRASDETLEKYDGKTAYVQTVDSNGWHYVTLDQEGKGDRFPVQKSEMELTLRVTLQKVESEPVKEKQEVAFTASFLTQLGIFVESLGYALDEFNGDESDILSKITEVSFVIENGEEPENGPRMYFDIVTTDPDEDGNMEYGVVMSEVEHG